MATLVLSAAGAAAGSSFGGTALGLVSGKLGRAAGAIAGNFLDQSILGEGSQAVQTGRVERLRLTGASEGTPLTQVYGRARVAGQAIWSSRFLERSETVRGGGKGSAPAGGTSYSYTINLALALCEGEITRVGRIWADGVEIAPADLNMRVYTGSEDQLPDPKIAAVEGAENVPAYRGVAYVVIEDLDLTPYGNRVPQLNFEVMRPERPVPVEQATGLARSIQAVAMMPGTGEYALATEPLYYRDAPGRHRAANLNTPGETPDFLVSLEALRDEVPNWESSSLIVSWFGDDLRCGECSIRPKIELRDQDAEGMPWHVSSLTRATAEEIPRLDGRPVYGGTPTDRSVIQAIEACRAKGSAVLFYPFLLMEQLAGNGRTDPWTGAQHQPPLPWRGRITTSRAPGQTDTPDGSGRAAEEVAAFFGTARPENFERVGEGVAYTGPEEWSYRRFILHCAHLCATAGGVNAFCIGSEMRSLTWIRDATGFPAVRALIALAADVREILPDAKITYAADWSEYFGYQPANGSGDVFFHLDPLWADPNIDFIGIDNYMPLSDWRDGTDHADAGWGSIYDLGYLQSNIEGGEGFDWYYASAEDERLQLRTPIEDGAHGEPWVFRYKDIRSWWENPHHERRGGVRAEMPTAWQPRSKPIWFTELGCAAVDKGTNQPNKFLDPKSSESAMPKYSSGVRDDLIQMQYLRAMFAYWRDPENNPVSPHYGGRMLDVSRAHVWAWDARPYPYFPANTELWSDGANYARGHWISGRVSSRSLPDVVGEICARSGVAAVDCDRLYGLVRGYSISEIAGARASLQPLMLAYGFDAVEREGRLVFRSRTAVPDAELSRDALVETEQIEGDVEVTRAAEAEISGRVRLTHLEADGAYEARTAEAVFPDEGQAPVAQSEMPLVFTGSEGRRIVERWLSEARVARDKIRFALPPSRMDVGPGDTVRFTSSDDLWRVDRIERDAFQILEATRVEPQIYVPVDVAEELPRLRALVPALPVHPELLDLPLLTGDEVPHAPHLAVAAQPWPGRVAVYGSTTDSGYELKEIVRQSAVIGETLSPLHAAPPGVPDRGPPLRVKLHTGSLAAVTWEALLGGANMAAIGGEDPQDWELLQFQRAEMVAPDTYDLSLRLRGQLGSDALMPRTRRGGARFVLIDQRLSQLDLRASARGVAQHYRIGPASRGYDSASYVHREVAFQGIGLRPYAPCHLRGRRADDAVEVSWIRRTRIDGDAWDLEDVPLGEAAEAYRLRIRHDGRVVREEVTSASNWTYPRAAREADGVTDGFTVEVAQISDRFGPGPSARLDMI